MATNDRLRRCGRVMLRAFNRLLLKRGPRPHLTGDLDDVVVALLRREQEPTDISDHLLAIHAETVEAGPRLIVELGTRGGESTDALIHAADRTDALVLSIDINNCSESADSTRWAFVQQDDVDFAARFPDWARSRGLEPRVDVLFIDSSHEYQHTLEEIDAWFPHLAPSAKVILHDTNLRPWYFRRNRTVGHGWRNRRGVIRALEEFLGVRIDETVAFTVVLGPWLVRHTPACNGLTVLRRLPPLPAGPLPTP